MPSKQMQSAQLSRARAIIAAARAAITRTKPTNELTEIWGMALPDIQAEFEKYNIDHPGEGKFLQHIVRKHSPTSSMTKPIKPPQAMTRPPVTTKPAALKPPTTTPAAPAPRAALPVIPTSADRRLATAICDEQERRAIAAKSMTRAAFSKLSAKDAMAHCKNGGLIV